MWANRIKKAINRTVQFLSVRKRITLLELEVRFLQGRIRLADYKHIHPKPLKIVLGAGNTYYTEWISTDINELNLTKEEDWDKWFSPNSIDRMLAEHVFEHLSMEENRLALSLCYKYLKPGASLRIAVPDANHPDENYINWVRPPKDGHKVLFSIEQISEMLHEIGYEIRAIEFFDKDGIFHAFPWNPADGFIMRSSKYDPLAGKRPGIDFYSSLIVDAIRPLDDAVIESKAQN